MGDYTVVKKFKLNDKNEWQPETLIYRDGQEEALLKEGRVPGQDFVKVTEEGTPERAERQATAYWNGTHEAPDKIESWVEYTKNLG